MLTYFKIQLSFRYGWKPQRYSVVVLPIGPSREFYIVCGRNWSVVFESNRPYFIRKGLRHRRPDIQLNTGSFSDNVFAEKLADAIWLHFQEMEKRK